MSNAETSSVPTTLTALSDENVKPVVTPAQESPTSTMSTSSNSDDDATKASESQTFYNVSTEKTYANDFYQNAVFRDVPHIKSVLAKYENNLIKFSIGSSHLHDKSNMEPEMYEKYKYKFIGYRCVHAKPQKKPKSSKSADRKRTLSTDCKAMFRINYRNETKDYCVTTCVMEHNHSPSDADSEAGPSKRRRPNQPKTPAPRVPLAALNNTMPSVPVNSEAGSSTHVRRSECHLSTPSTSMASWSNTMPSKVNAAGVQNGSRLEMAIANIYNIRLKSLMQSQGAVSQVVEHNLEEEENRQKEKLIQKLKMMLKKIKNVSREDTLRYLAVTQALWNVLSEK